MGKITIFVIDDNDRAQIKSYSEKITKICKLAGYNPLSDSFEDFFDISTFDFIPCIKEGEENTVGDDERFMEEVGIAIDEAYDPKIEVTLDEVKKEASERGQGLRSFINDRLDDNYRTNKVVDWIFENCDDNTIQKFINWAIN